MLLVASFLLTVAAGVALLALYAELPANQLQHVDLSALSAARERYRGPAAEASVLIATSYQITLAARDPNMLPAVIDEARGRLRLVTTTGLGHAQYLTLVLMQFDRAGEPAETWWPRISDSFVALRTRPLEHRLPAFVEAERAAWALAGMSERTAAARAESMCAAHGVFLQLFVSYSRRMTDALRAAGEHDAAAACERIALHVLRAMVLQDGPLELRVPAAGLLAEMLGSRESATERERAALSACAALRATVHRAAIRDRNELSALRGAEPSMLGASHDRAARAVVPLWLASAGAGAAVVAIVALVMARVRRRVGPMRLFAVIVAVGCVLALCVAAFVTVDRAPSLVNHDLTRLSSENAGVPRGPIIFLAVGAALVVIAAAFAPESLRRESRIRTVATAAALAWPLLMLAALMLYPSARGVLMRPPVMDSSAASQASVQQEVTAFDGPLRDWTP